MVERRCAAWNPFPALFTQLMVQLFSGIQIPLATDLALNLNLLKPRFFRVSSGSFDYSGSFKFVPSLSIQVERLKVSQTRKSEQTSANQIQLHSVYMDVRKLKIESKKSCKEFNSKFLSLKVERTKWISLFWRSSWSLGGLLASQPVAYTTIWRWQQTPSSWPPTHRFSYRSWPRTLECSKVKTRRLLYRRFRHLTYPACSTHQIRRISKASQP